MAKTNAIIIKRPKKAAHAHHGGAWKVAYADFVTAMMAFFLLLWLLNATTDAQKRGIADYFSPSLASKSTTSGAGGVLGGRTMAEKGSMASSSAPPAVTIELNPPPDFEDSDEDETPGKAQNPNDTNSNAAGYPNSAVAQANPNDNANDVQANKLTERERIELQKLVPGQPVDADKLTEAQYQALKAAREEKQFEKAQYELQQAIQKVPDLQQFAQNLVVDRTNEGLRIQLVDQEKTSMFPLGSSDMNEAGRKLMALVAQAVAKLPNKIAITGHTDATPFAKAGNYGNWELSTDRANASRRALLAANLPADRIATVVGKADTEPFVPDDPNSPRNRRISIVLLRENGPVPAAAGPQPPQSAAVPQTPAEH